ncbi:MAG: hypothetical protein C0624_09075 [Desulfuromonas sp.]|nr:MAG: hypothetical protein C0624_09075 [Desulfuromonas sp.]
MFQGISRIIIVVCLLLATVSPALAASSELLQRDWMIGLVDGLGWSFGLPDDPGDDDYLRILSGKRTFRYEAEALCSPNDLVSVKSYRAYGYCSGEGWLSGISKPTTAHLQILVPLSGTFELGMRLRRQGHQVQFGEQTFAADAGEMFENVVLGELTLNAGLHDVTLQLPADGAVDYLELRASQITAIEPTGGWQPDVPLRLADLAVTVSQLLALEEWLLPSGEQKVYQAETARLVDGAVVTTIRHLGEPDGGAWVRAGNVPGRLNWNLELSPGVYRLLVRGMGERPLHLEIPGKLQRDVLFKPYLMDVDLGFFHLEELQRLSIDLPPRTGVDQLRLQGYRATPDDFLRLTGLAAADGPVTSGQLDELLTLLVTLAEPR